MIVSGFVSISTGRTRGTEDVDVLVPVMSKEKFENLFDDLQKIDFGAIKEIPPKRFILTSTICRI